MSKGCKMMDYQIWHLNRNQWENKIHSIHKRDGKASSWKRVEEYKLNKTN
jgi:hypothetical protein